MAMITRNEYGVVAVNNSVLCKMIIDRLLRLDDVLLPCSRKGRPIRKGFFTGFNDYANAVEIIGIKKKKPEKKSGKNCEKNRRSLPKMRPLRLAFRCPPRKH